ncbi:Membrane protein involved in the export of O-antigen and teichoic acid [Haladaptatus litoreus]|uniref:Membrane protein involved in the export of O-antigen and teichoic acid n=1 Tax=Haladaptatus litoreus TaxID=553468 RepID=A0A1N7DBU8_9EURY|nr:flippase [Haladaptatus litoreus]SIR73244.1 Membrane protein involved in the export of O-antigen and teichoic acid [Haladaptatus litoreus]
MTKSKRNTLIESAGFVIISKLVLLGSGFIVTPLLTRTLGQSAFGVFTFVVAVFGIIRLMSMVGFFDSLRKHIAETDDIDTISDYFSIGLIFTTISGVVVSAIGIIVMLYTGADIGAPATSIAFIIIFGVISGNAYQISRSLFHGIQQEQISTKIEIVRNTLYLIFTVIGAIVGGSTGALVGFTFSFFIASLYGMSLSHKRGGISSVNIKFNKQHIDKLLRYGSLQAVGGIAAMLLYKTDIILMGTFTNSESVAIYKSALLSAELVWVIPSAIQMVLLQNVSFNYSSNNIRKINNSLTKSIRYVSIFVFLTGMGIFYLSSDFLHLYFGPNYVSASMPMRILLLGTILLGITRVISPALQATGWIKHSQIGSVLALTVNIVLNVLLIPEYGATGAAIGTSISYLVIFASNTTIFYFTDMKLTDRKLVPKLIIAFSLFSLLLGGLNSVIQLSPFYKILVISSSGFLLFISILIPLGLIEQSELESAYNTATTYITNAVESSDLVTR